MKRTALLAVVVLTGCGGSSNGAQGGSSDGAPPRTASVNIENFQYGPRTVTIRAGGTVTFANSDTANHTATAGDGSFDSGNLKQGKSSKVTFDKPGTIAYVCQYHPSMAGTVEVK